jgi:hypothetical protein
MAENKQSNSNEGEKPYDRNVEDKVALGTGTFATLIDKKFFSKFWEIKLRLQFTGWLQYIPLSMVSIVFIALATFAYLLKIGIGVFLFGAIGIILFSIILFDLITVKFHFHPQEKLPHPKDDLDFYGIMRARHSCRSFQIRKLTQKDHDELLKSIQFHSKSSFSGQSSVRFEYLSAPLTVWPVVNATEFLVAIAPKEYNRLDILDVGHNLQKIVIDATRLGLGTCWIGPGVDHSSVIAQLGNRYDPDKDHIICVCAVGYPSKYIPVFVRIFNHQFLNRLPLNTLFFSDERFEKPLNVETSPFNRFDRNYEVCQWAPSSYNGQTTRCVALTDKGGSLFKRMDFYATTKSRYYAPIAVGIWCANWELGCEELGITGHFKVLPEMAKNGEKTIAAGFPIRYDISWLPD